MGIAEDIIIEFHDREHKLFSLNIINPLTKTSSNFADNGCGISQLLPLIVESQIVDDRININY